MSNKADVLRKLKALSDRGIGGEADNAKALYDKLLIKYDIEEEEILSEQVSDYEFAYWGLHGKELLSQVCAMILGHDFVMKKYTHRRDHLRIVPCTLAESLEIRETYEFYRNVLDMGLRKYFEAFIYKERLFDRDYIPDKEEDSGSKVKMDAEFYGLFNSMNSHDMLKRIEHKE